LFAVISSFGSAQTYIRELCSFISSQSEQSSLIMSSGEYIEVSHFCTSNQDGLALIPTYSTIVHEYVPLRSVAYSTVQLEYFQTIL